MRVLFVAHSYPRTDDDVAGGFLLHLARALQDTAGVTVRVLAPAAAGLARRAVIGGVEVRRYRYAPAPLQTLAYTGEMADAVRRSWGARAALGGLLGAGAAAVARESRAFGADLVHAHWWFPGALSSVVPGAAGGRPIVTTLHGSDVRLAYRTAPARRLFALVAARCDALTAVSSWLCARATEMAPRAPHCAVAPMPIAPGLFTPPPPGAHRDGILFVGRLTRQKGVDRLLRACATGVVAAPVTIVGTGGEEGELRRLARELRIAQRVTWLPPQPRAVLAGLYRHARVLAVPSQEEGLGLVAVEAAFCGTPVVAFASGGLVDVVVDGATGRLVPPDDIAAFARALDDVLGDAAYAAELGANAAHEANVRFSPGAVAARYVRIYETALRARAAV